MCGYLHTCLHVYMHIYIYTYIHADAHITGTHAQHTHTYIHAHKQVILHDMHTRTPLGGSEDSHMQASMHVKHHSLQGGLETGALTTEGLVQAVELGHVLRKRYLDSGLVKAKGASLFVVRVSVCWFGLIYTYVCQYVCMYACMYICIACMYVRMYIYI